MALPPTHSCPTCGPPQIPTTSKDSSAPEIPRTSLLWMPSRKAEKKVANPPPNSKMWADGLRTKRDEVFTLWSMVEISVPPLLARKYHIVNVTELMKNGEDRKFYGVATWFVMWCQAFGPQYLYTAQRKYVELKSIHKDERQDDTDEKIIQQVYKLRKWRADVAELLILIGKARTVPTAPTLKDNCTKAADFLLEPCIIIQLPWNTVLFHQWLVAALTEVLIFEKNALELRHWSIPKEILDCATSLLVLVKEMKEKIVLGFSMLSRLVTVHPQIEPHQPSWVLEDVVLPSLAALHFLISGKANVIIKSIKKIAWASHGCTKERVYMPVAKYTMHEHLTDIFSQFFYSFPCLNLTFQAPFPLPKINIIGLWKVIQEIKFNLAVPKRSIDDSRKELTIGEECAFNFASVKIPDGLDVDERINLTLSTIKDLLIDSGRIKQSEYQNVSRLIKELDRKVIDKLFYRDNKSDVKMMVLHTMMYWQLGAMLLECEKENSVWACVVVHQLEILQKEQLLRIANLICLVSTTQSYPLVPKLDKSPPMSVDSMSQILEKVRAKRETQTKDWLWNQFSPEWRKPVNIHEPPLQMSFGVPAIVKACEERIGRLVLNIARASYSVYEKGGEMYPHAQTVQYILPCYVASFVDSMKTLKIELHQPEGMLKFLHSALEFYEATFFRWRKKITPRKDVEIGKLEPTYDDCIYVQEILLLLKEYRIQNSMLQAYYTQSKLNENPIGDRLPVSPQPFFGFTELNDALLEWPLDITTPTYSYLGVYHFVKVWLEKSFQLQMNIHDISYSAWKPLSPGTPLQCEQFSELYHAYCVLNIMCVVFQIYLKYLHRSYTGNQLEYLTLLGEKIDVCVIDWKTRFEYYQFVVKCDSKKESELLAFVNKSKGKMFDLYKSLKTCRQLICSSVKPKFLIENISKNTPELKLACKYYLNADFKSLEKIISIIINWDSDENDGNAASANQEETEEKEATTDHADTSDKKLEESSSGTNSQVDTEQDKSSKKQTRNPKRSETSKICRNCSRKERQRDVFLTCEKCVEQEYPDINFFCSKKCQEKWWKEEHMAEHLEFELGLSNFSHLNLK